MYIFHPNHAQILDIQERQQGYYFSKAFDAILRKHGYIIATAPIEDSCGETKFGFVSRMVQWNEEFEESPFVFEGTISKSVADKLHIECITGESKQLNVYDREKAVLGVLGYKQANVRKIPRKARRISQPGLYISSNPLWNNQTIPYQYFPSTNRGEPILFIKNSDSKFECVGLRLERHIILGIPLLDVIVQNHSMPPFKLAGYYNMAKSHSTKSVEAWLLQYSSNLFTENGKTIIRTDSWPYPYQSAFTVRHDYDRIITDRAVNSLLEFYNRRKVKSTWFWLLKTSKPSDLQRDLRKGNVFRRFLETSPRQANQVANAGHEVALHTMAGNGKQFSNREVRFFRNQLGIEPRGYSAHGGSGSPGYLGSTQMEWAIENNLAYGEILGCLNHYPHQAIVISNNIPQSSCLILPRTHFSLDAGMKPDAHHYDIVLPDIIKAIQNGEQCVLMNHPDIHVDALQKLIDNLDLSTTWKATLEEISDWFLRVKLNVKCNPSSTGLSIIFPEATQYRIGLIITSRNGSKRITLPAGTQEFRIPLSDKPLPVGELFHTSAS